MEQSKPSSLLETSAARGFLTKVDSGNADKNPKGLQGAASASPGSHVQMVGNGTPLLLTHPHPLQCGAEQSSAPLICLELPGDLGSILPLTPTGKAGQAVEGAGSAHEAAPGFARTRCKGCGIMGRVIQRQ